MQLGSDRLWAFLLAAYWVSIVAYYLTWKAYNHVSTLRAEALMSPEIKAEQFAIIVRDIPPVPEGQTRKEQIDSFFRNIYPDTFYRSMIVTDNKEVRSTVYFLDLSHSLSQGLLVTLVCQFLHLSYFPSILCNILI